MFLFLTQAIYFTFIQRLQVNYSAHFIYWSLRKFMRAILVSFAIISIYFLQKLNFWLLKLTSSHQAKLEDHFLQISICSFHLFAQLSQLLSFTLLFITFLQLILYFITPLLILSGLILFFQQIQCWQLLNLTRCYRLFRKICGRRRWR